LGAAQQRQLQILNESSAASSKNLREEVQGQMTQLSQTQKGQLDSFQSQLTKLIETNQSRFEELRKSFEQRHELLKTAVEQKLAQLQQDNAAKLEEMRKTVDEKLQSTLETRLSQSFKQVSERLEQVHKGLGEMQNLATGVGDLKKVLTNVKTRGTWGEVQLANLLEQILTPEQYATNVKTNPATNDHVEFAIKLPGKDESSVKPVFLPIDSKFPVEDFQRLIEASERADVAGVESAGKQLELRLKSCASDIQTKYLCPPDTTDFGILFLPYESLYAEALRRPGLVESLQQQYHVVVSGPTTLAALLNSLQMGFRTLAIQKRSSEVWKVLGAVKTEFGKFGEVINKVRDRLVSAQNEIEKVGTRTRALTRNLREVEALPVAQAQELLKIGALETGDEPSDIFVED